ncbi:unnamed protein product [Adineta steineri]|uniref:G-protein coupled receptors family 1 profile domain-containing protein n=1 Tax=Adineta steineri TaxID=433720 RepID=A0A813MW30_9BILA|nr:unnamed protein product [Adineta steineri]CAF3712619.1 unnamed protein product [Adineta steineri]
MMDMFQIVTSLFMLFCSVLGVVCSLIFIVIVFLDRRCRTPIVLISLNTAIAGFIINTIYASQAIYQMISDSSDVLCIFRGFLLHSSTGLFYQSLCIQAIYRLFVTVFAQRRNLQSKYVIIPIIVIQWIISSTFGIPILLMKRLQFQETGRICQVPINDIFGFMYLATFIYFLPVTGIIFIYIAILKYTKRSLIIANVRQLGLEQTRYRRELRFIKRILILISIIFITGVPYLTFFLQVNIGQSPMPSYGHRISFMFLSCGQGLVMLLAIFYADDVRKSLRNILLQKLPWIRGRRIGNIIS